jgi:hypothetical protein
MRARVVANFVPIFVQGLQLGLGDVAINSVSDQSCDDVKSRFDAGCVQNRDGPALGRIVSIVKGERNESLVDDVEGQ